MARFKQGDDLNQPFLLPPSMKDWLPSDHLVWFIDEAVDAMDVEALVDQYRVCGKGELPYPPRLMLKILIYAYSTGVFSSRKIAAKLEDSIAFRVLARGQSPSHRTICRFREQFIDHFQGLFVQVVQMACTSGMATLGRLAIDGSKVKANASKRKAMSYDRMKSEEKRIAAEIKAITKMAADEDAAEDIEFGPEFRGDQLPEELNSRKKRIAAIRRAKKELEDRKATEEAERSREREERARAEGKEPPKKRKTKHPRGKPKPKDQQNFTDADSRIMMSNGSFEQCYNVQAAVDADHQIIVASELTNCPADNNVLIETLDAAEANTGLEASRLLADAGYKSENNLRTLENRKLDAYIALGREGYDRSSGKPTGEATQRMAKKLKGKRARKRYRERKHIVEPVFGWVKNVLGFRAFSLRGLKKVSGEWALICAALNLRRMQDYVMPWEAA